MFIKNKSPSKATKIALFSIVVMASTVLLGSNVHAEGVNFSVTVPMEFPLYMDENGDVTAANNIQIINNSDDSISVKDISVNALNNWNLIDYFSDFSIFGNNEKYLGLMFNGDSADASGSVALNSPSWENIGSMTSLDIAYDGKLPLQTSAANNGQVAQVVFTIDWTVLTGPITHTAVFTSGANGTLQEGSPYTINDIPDGGTITFPTPQPNYMYRFEGWVDLNTGQSVTEATTITKDMDIVAEFIGLDPVQTIGNIIMNIQTGIITGNTFAGTAGDVIIPDMVTIEGVDYFITNIGAGAFQGQAVNSLTVSNGIASIGANAFNGCSINKNGVTINNYPGGITIDTSAFLNNHANGKTDIYNDLTYTMQAPAGLIAMEEPVVDDEMLIIIEETDSELIEDITIEDTTTEKDHILDEAIDYEEKPQPIEEEPPIIEEEPPIIEEEPPIIEEEPPIIEEESPIIEEEPQPQPVDEESQSETTTTTDGAIINEETIIDDEIYWTVTFYTIDNEVLHQFEVLDLEDVIPPEAPTIEGFEFVRWDGEYTNINKDKELFPIYKKIEEVLQDDPVVDESPQVPEDIIEEPVEEPAEEPVTEPVTEPVDEPAEIPADSETDNVIENESSNGVIDNTETQTETGIKNNEIL